MVNASRRKRRYHLIFESVTESTMEELKFLPNGQWILSKANKFGPDNVEYGTTWEERSKDQFLTGKDAEGGRKSVLRTFASDNHPIKQMKNLHTGKSEPHLLMQRGIDNDQREIKPDGKTANSIHWTPDEKYVSHETHAIHGPGHGNGDYATQGYSESKDENEVTGKHFSFWVPLSHIVSTRNYADGALKNTKKFNSDSGHKGFGGEPYVPHKQPDGGVPEWDSHIIVKPGKYRTHKVQDWGKKPNEKGHFHDNHIIDERTFQHDDE
jgi:hypothetical protein